MAATTPTPTGTDPTSSAAQEQQLLQEQQAMYLQQQKFETESSMLQSQHDTMMAIIRAIAS